MNALERVGHGVSIALYTMFLFLALAAARVFGLFFYTLLIVFFDLPSWLISTLSRPAPEVEAKQIKKHKHIPEGWVRILICPTTDISELDLYERESIESNTEGAGQHEDTFSVLLHMDEVRTKVDFWLECMVGEEDGVNLRAEDSHSHLRCQELEKGADASQHQEDVG